jgi:3-hydroxyphenylacetate 6-hydroxylase
MALQSIVATAFNSVKDDWRVLAAAPLILLVAYLLANEVVRASARLKDFKGPKGWPVVGNIPDIRVNAAEKYRQWSKIFGPVFQIQLGNVPILVVNSSAQAREVFLTNSRATNSRPMFYTFHKIVSSTAGFTIGTSPMDESLKRRRKAAATALNRPAVQTYMPHIDLETEKFVEECLEASGAPVDPLPLIQRVSLNLSLTLNWGTRLSDDEKELFEEITHVEDYISRARSTTGNLQDYIPILRLNPYNKNSQIAVDMRKRRDVYLNKMNRDLEERMRNKTYKPCIQANVLLDPEARLDARELMSISLTMVSGGLDTITTLVVWALAFLAQRPDIQDKAYEAIRDMYTDDEPLCDPLEDQKCAYVVALVRELLRVYTPLRLNLPRFTTKDFVYEGKRVPANTVVFLNAWACNHDPELFPDPDEFIVERWIENPNNPIFTYGQGARMCAGFLMANRELYLLFMRLLSCFKIEKHDEVDANPITGVEDPKTLVSMPRPYRIRFVPRNPEKLAKAIAEFKPVQVESN